MTIAAFATFAAGCGDDDADPTPTAATTATPADGLTALDRNAISALQAATYPADLADGTRIGRQDAPLKLVIYEDFQCPFCLFYNAFVEPSLVANWVDTNQLQIEFRHFLVLGNESAAAAVASECAADQQAFWEYHRALFLAQAEAGQLSGEQLNVGRFSADNLKQHAARLGLDAARFDACLDDQAHLELLAQQEQTAHGLGVTGTPTFFLNDQVVRPAPSTVEEWNLLLLEAIGEVTGD